MKDPKPPTVYAFEPEIEMAIVFACCTQPRYYSVIGHAIEAERCRDKTAREVMQVVHVLAEKNGIGPSWTGAVVQHVATLMSRGKATLSQLNAVKDYLLDAESSVPDVPMEELISTTVPVVQRVKHREAVNAALESFKNSGDLDETAAQFDAVSKLGKTVAVSGGTLDQLTADPNFFAAPSTKDVLAFGITELDQAIGGGMERRALGLLVGSSGAGKSMALAHGAVEAFLAGHNVFYLTLELSVQKTSARIVRNLIDMTRRETELDPALALARLAAVKALPTVGKLWVEYAEPLVTSPRDIRQRVAQVKREQGWDPDVFVIDFIDKIRSNHKASQYEDMLSVVDQSRSMAVDADGWCLTASQADRKSTTRPWLDLDAVADSMNKVRSADIVIGIGRTEEDQQTDMIRFTVPKRREGEGAHTRVGPIPWDPERGRISIVTTRTYPW